jgi:hypothetical protein
MEKKGPGNGSNRNESEIESERPFERLSLRQWLFGDSCGHACVTK